MIMETDTRLKLSIGCYYGHSAMSIVTKFRTWSAISHVSLIFSTEKSIACKTVEAVGPGVRCQTGFDKWHKPDTRIDIFRVEATHYQVEKVLQFASEQIGKPYDWAGIYGFIRRRDAQNPAKWFCSELVFAACAFGGIHLLSRIPAHKVAPADVFHSPLLVFDRTYVTQGPAPAKNAQKGPKVDLGAMGVATRRDDQYAACLRPNAAWSGGCTSRKMAVGGIFTPEWRFA